MEYQAGPPLADAQTLFQSAELTVYWLDQVPYEATWAEMKSQVQARLAAEQPEADQLWLLHHDPVYTLGTRGVRAGLIGDIQAPVVKTDRGGDVTYHGPGQLVGYPLVQLDRLGLSGATFVHALEALLVELLIGWGVGPAVADPDRPGVYIDRQKIASLGLRCKRSGRRQISYHGFALNVDMDMAPFSQINPCGYAGQAMTQLKTLLLKSSLMSREVAPEGSPSGDAAIMGLSPQASTSDWVKAAATDFAQCFGDWHQQLLQQRQPT